MNNQIPIVLPQSDVCPSKFKLLLNMHTSMNCHFQRVDIMKEIHMYVYMTSKCAVTNSNISFIYVFKFSF